MANELLCRLIEGLNAAKVTSGRGRVKEIAEKTGYSAGMVSRILTGKVDPAGKFVFAVCAAFKIGYQWVMEGKRPVLVSHMEVVRLPEDATLEDAFKRTSVLLMEQIAKDAQLMVLDQFYEMCKLVNLPEIFIEGVKELEKMPDSERYKTVGDMKRKNELLRLEKETEEFTAL